MTASLGDMDDSSETGTARSAKSAALTTVPYRRAAVVPVVPRFQRNL